MKGIILCSGIKTKLDPLNYTCPEPMLPIANIPLIEYTVKQLVDDGIKNIAIVVGENGQQFVDYLRDGNRLNCKIKYYFHHKSAGTVNALLRAKDFIDDDVVVISGDNYFDFSIKNQIREFRVKRYDGVVFTKEVENIWEHTIGLYKDKRLVRVIDKPKINESNVAIMGIYLFKEETIRGLSKLRHPDKGENGIAEIIQNLIEKDAHIHSEMITSECINIGKIKNLIQCNKYVLSKGTEKNIADSSSKISDSTIGEFVSIGKRTVIKNSKIVNSIIMDDCIIDGVEISDSIVGNFSTISGNGKIRGVFGHKSKLFITNR
ncbi:hypothetical protein Q428_08480 [Fervidicella metallireducens AeB]|uniref:Nucleotidyl transferase domain-containing protein n=1 Tax=Fervidicella metallireducens AeB TaxID=1403537 RepID=A0A017RV80_9CLOT|nr:sugar phosphate nucleotidyltransferase [Fervidicella metallireducens]EYE88334.1 hypothetical protein Q428_08480 [Fervidicella metallireducens AeB]